MSKHIFEHVTEMRTPELKKLAIVISDELDRRRLDDTLDGIELKEVENMMELRDDGYESSR